MPPAGYFCDQTKVPKSWLRGKPPENPLLAAGAVGWSVGIGQCPTCGSEGGNWERSGHSRPALQRAPSPETPGFCVLSSYFCTAGGKFDRTANKNTPPQEPAAKREGRVQSGSQRQASPRADGTAAPGDFARAAELRRQPTREFLEP